MFATKTQEVVINARMGDGYKCLGVVSSLVNGLDAFVLVKGKHTLVINSLGYDEHNSHSNLIGIREVHL